MSARHRPPVPPRPHLEFETALWSHGIRYVAGIDEAGRGAWAGPVVAAAVILPHDHPDLPGALNGVTDSKKLSPAARQALFERVQHVALAVGVGAAGATEVDRDGLMPATRATMERAVAALPVRPEHLLIDAVDLRSDVALPQQWMYFGDAISLSIAAASIVAKVSRDRLMRAMDARYPGYAFARHKGYGTEAHREALEALGPVSIHRKSFKPIAACFQWQLSLEGA